VVLDSPPESLPPVRSKVSHHDLKDRGLMEGGGFGGRSTVSHHDLKDRGLWGVALNKDVHPANHRFEFNPIPNVRLFSAYALTDSSADGVGVRG
jgi:hypothetical protein